MKHTKGNWITKDGQIYPQETGRTIAVIPYFDKDSECANADAKLIAAAPDLLEALQMLDDAIASGNTERMTDILLTYGRPAISKAIH